MTTATRIQPSVHITGTPGVGTMAVVALRDSGFRPDDALRGGEINEVETDPSMRKASTTAGVGLLAMSVLSAFGYLIAVKGVVGAPG
jgi:hypothetical protein